MRASHVRSRTRPRQGSLGLTSPTREKLNYVPCLLTSLAITLPLRSIFCATNRLVLSIELSPLRRCPTTRNWDHMWRAIYSLPCTPELPGARKGAAAFPAPAVCLSPHPYSNVLQPGDPYLTDWLCRPPIPVDCSCERRVPKSKCQTVLFSGLAFTQTAQKLAKQA